MNQENHLPRGNAAHEGVPPQAVSSLIRRWQKENLEIHSMMLLRHGKVIAQGWWKPYRPEFEHMLNSLSKSFVSIAVGFAVQEGLMTTQTFLLDIFPEYRDLKIDPKMHLLQIKHLLCMCTGHAVNADFIFEYDDPVRAFMTSELKEEPGKHFRYNTGATFMFSAAVTRLTGLRVFDYLRPRLFEPLGMAEGVWWERCGSGEDVGGYGLNVKTEDLAKFGQFLLNRGVFKGKRLLNEEWIDCAAAKHINNNASTMSPWLDRTDEADEPENVEATDWNCGYGYQFWRCIPPDVYRADGAFGQYVVVMPKKDTVFVVTAGCVDTEAILVGIWEDFLPALSDSPVPGSEQEEQELESLLGELTLPPVAGTAAAPAFTGKRAYQMRKNPLGIRTVRICCSKEGPDRIELVREGRTDCFFAGKNEWADTDLRFVPEGVWPFRMQAFPNISCSAGWTGENEYTLKVVNNRMSYNQTAVCRLEGERLTVTVTQNLACPDPVILTGTTIAE